jgi:hypothetical protein
MAYDHGNSPPSPAGVAITGGVFYPANSTFGSVYAGKYLFSDYGANFIRVFDPANPGSNATPDTSSDFASDVTGGAPVDLKVDTTGRLYYLARGTGKIYRIESLAPAILQQPADTFVGFGRPGSLSVQASGAATLLYQWHKFNGTSWDPIGGATSASFTINSAVAGDAGQYRVVVTNDSGTVTSNPASITLDQVPTGTIAAPNSYILNDIVNFSGTGDDSEDGTLSASAFSWHVDFHHDGQVQPHVAEFGGTVSGMFTASAAATDPGQFYRIVLTVTDSKGIASTITRDVFPDTALLTVASQPGGVPLTLDGQPVTGSVTSVIGVARTLAAPLMTTLGDFPYRFVGWSDGGLATHSIATPLFATSYVASYARVTPGLDAEFFDFNTNLTALPDLTALTPDLSRTDAIVSYAATAKSWSGLGVGFADSFAVRHTGLARVDKFGRYTFSLKSGDGSKLWLDGELIVDNDGVHGMLEKSATRTLDPGYHDLRVEMFENTGTAGLVLSWAGPGFAKQAIPATRLFHDMPGGAAAFRQDSGADGLVVLEAEDHDGTVARTGRSWQPSASGTGYSGVGVMRESPNAGVSYNTNFVVKSPRLDYRVNFLQAGTYFVWARGKGTTTTDDSLHLGLDGNPSSTADRIFGLKSAYNWTNATADKVVATIDVPTPGIHTVNVWMWEDGVILDKLLLTTSALFVPTGLGPSESVRPAPSVDQSAGFAGATGLQLNGSAAVVGSVARLTPSLNNRAGSVFAASEVDVTGFATTFDFRLTSAVADGFAFVIQGNTNTALGAEGEGLGYQGINNSLAIKFDLFDNAGEGGNSTGLYTNGQSPSSGGSDLTPSGIILNSGHDFRAALAYGGATLSVVITDLMTGATANQTYAVNITGLVGGNTAFVGFTGGTGSSSATQDILNWTYWN